MSCVSKPSTPILKQSGPGEFDGGVAWFCDNQLLWRCLGCLSSQSFWWVPCPARPKDLPGRFSIWSWRRFGSSLRCGSTLRTRLCVRRLYWHLRLEL